MKEYNMCFLSVSNCHNMTVIANKKEIEPAHQNNKTVNNDATIIFAIGCTTCKYIRKAIKAKMYAIVPAT